MTGPSGLVVDAVISAFEPGEDLAGRIHSLLPQVRRVVVVDDGSPGPWPTNLPEDVVVIRLEENSGIAVALNRGVAACLEDGAEAVLTLDQDSDLPAGGVAQLVATLGEAGDGTAFSAPEFFAGVSQVHRTDGRGRRITRHTIQSGMLVPAATWERVGLLREDLFIDLVDTEFEMRCASAGLDGVATVGLRLGHRLGTQQRRHGWLGRLGIVGISHLTLSTPFRYYYRVRNRVVVNRERMSGTFAWRLRDTFVEAIHFVNVLSIARPRRAMWRIMTIAVRDGRAGRTGRMPAQLAPVAREVRWAADVIASPEDEA